MLYPTSTMAKQCELAFIKGAEWVIEQLKSKATSQPK